MQPQASSSPDAMKQHIQGPASPPAASSSELRNPHGPASYSSAHSSWSSMRGLSNALGPPKPPLAWASVRHQVVKGVQEVEDIVEEAEQINTGQCQHAVLITCLHLAHEMNMREVGQYAWYQPQAKDAHGSMLKIMKSYGRLIQDMDDKVQIAIRSAPDPSKQIIQHHLLRSRQLAGPDSYIMAFYNGHGIQEPPTEAGELWCYDKSFEECALDGSGPTEYIPMVLFEVLSWAGASTCYVWDCHHAGRLVQSAHQEAAEIDRQLTAAAIQNPEIAQAHPAIYAKRQIHFAACGPDERNPKILGMPDDLFTICLLTPLKIALLYHNLQTFPLSSMDSSKQRSAGYMEALWESMSGDLKSRLWSELQAILHTIAWQSLDGTTYQRIFGQYGQSISQLASGFLLSQRVLGAYNVKPESIPSIPSTTAHPLWITWDLILENFFEQLPEYMDRETDPNWEGDIQMLSFMEDQLNSILTSNSAPIAAYQADAGNHLAVGKLPIICQAASVKSLRVQACHALDACLEKLGPKELVYAVQCGALDVALNLLEREDSTIANQVISIWASLIKHSGAVSQLAAPIKQASFLSDVKAIVFLLHHLEDGLTIGHDVKVIECAAILCTIISHITKRKALKFLDRCLDLSMRMLDQQHALIQQWGALLCAELLHGLDIDEKEHQASLENMQQKLLSLVKDRTVETRAAMLYALRWWFKMKVQTDLTQLKDQLHLASLLLPQSATDAAIQVRQEMYVLLQHVLVASGRWAAMALWLYQAQQAVLYDGNRAREVVNMIGRLKAVSGINADNFAYMAILMQVVKMVDVYSKDPEVSVAEMAQGCVLRCNHLSKALGSDMGKVEPPCISVLLRDAERLIEVWPSMEGTAISSSLAESNQDLFKLSRLSLRAYLASTQRMPENDVFNKDKDNTWVMRHRVLEDSLVLSEQQAGLPWKWHMKDIESPDPWSTLTCHSFNSTVLSCNNSHDLLLWDWASSRKTGTIHLDLPVHAQIKSGRFVNELHETNVVLAEINTGDIHVFAGPSEEPSKMKPISSFLALNMKEHAVNMGSQEDKSLVTTWWRLSGLLGVGGAASIVNIWDCPAEQRVRHLKTEEDSVVTTLITEPKSGNLLIAGLANGKIKMFDIRQSRATCVLQYQADMSGIAHTHGIRGIKKLGVFLGESRHITSACANGMINIHDIRQTSQPAASKLVHPTGISSASFQPHSGLMSTVSGINPSGSPGNGGRPYANFGLYRSTLATINTVTEEAITFGDQLEDVNGGRLTPYTIFHPLRPFLGLGYGRSCHLRGSGVGKGDDTDSGSYRFLQLQAKYML